MRCAHALFSAILSEIFDFIPVTLGTKLCMDICEQEAIIIIQFTLLHLENDLVLILKIRVEEC